MFKSMRFLPELYKGFPSPSNFYFTEIYDQIFYDIESEGLGTKITYHIENSNDGFVIKVYVPEIDPKDLKVEYNNSIIRVFSNEKLIKSFNIDKKRIDENSIESKYKFGVLTITASNKKKEEVPAKEIPIKFQ